MSFEAKQSAEGKENLQDISDAGQQLLANIAQLADTETNPDRAKAMSDLAPKLIDLFPEFQTIPDVQDLLLLNPDTNRSVIQDTLASIDDQYLQAFNKALDPNNANFKKSQGVLSSIIEERIMKVFIETKDQQKQEEKTEIVTDLSQQVEVNNEEIESTEKQLVEATKLSQKNALTAHPDLASQVVSPETLDITDADTPETKAEKQAKQEQVAQQLWTTTAYLTAKLQSNSQYTEAWLSIGQLLSFLQTEQALWNNGIDSDPFLADVAQIRDDLQIPTPKTAEVDNFPDWGELPAQQLGNLSTEQIQNPDNAQFADFVQYQEVPADKTDYTSNDLSAWLETDLHNDLPTGDDTDNQVALLNRNSPLTAQQAQTLRDTQATINTHRNSFKTQLDTSMQAIDDFAGLTPDSIGQLRHTLNTPEHQHNEDFKQIAKALSQRFAIFKQHGGKVEAPDPRVDAPAGRVKLAKTLNNAIRTETTRSFLTTVADSMTTMIDGMNTGAKAKIKTETKKRNPTYSQIPFSVM